MKISSLERLYTKINDHIILIASHTEQKCMNAIIRMCRLKPLDLFKHHRYRDIIKLQLYKCWVDEFGGSLNLIKNKRIQIILPDLELTSPIICTDLYACLPIDKIKKVSKILYLLVGKTKTHQKHGIIAFIGIDGYLRTYSFTNNEWQTISPLQLGFRVLKNIAENQDIKYYIELKNKRTVILECAEQKSWISNWPPHKDFIETIKEYDFIYDILKSNEGE